MIVCKNGRSAGKEMAQLTWLGTDGDIECPAFPDAYEQIKIKYGNLERNKVYLVKVSPDQRNPGKVILEDVLRLSNCGYRL